MAINLTAQVIVITGAAGALGAAYARECADRGAALLLTDIAEEPLAVVVDGINRQGGLARAAVGDIADNGFGDELVAECQRRWGVVTGWVNNAGVQRLQGIESDDTSAVEMMVRVNLLGTVFGTAAAARAMIPQGSGSILNVTSGAQHGMKHLAVYGATKGGIASLTYAAAIDLAEHGIRVNAVSPLANTQMSIDGDSHFSVLSGAEVHAAESLNSPDLIAPVVAYLLAAADGITGQVVRFDGQTLSIVRHPEIDRASAVTADHWDAESIAAAFDDSLRGALYSTVFATPARPLT